MAGVAIASTVSSCVLAELIRNVTECGQSARRCKSEWTKLEKELKEIQPDVMEIEKKVVELEKRESIAEHRVLKMVKAWLERLKEKMDLANIEVHRCNSSKFHHEFRLSGKLTSMHNEIASIANARVTLFMQLEQLFPDQQLSSVKGCMSTPKTSPLGIHLLSTRRGSGVNQVSIHRKGVAQC